MMSQNNTEIKKEILTKFSRNKIHNLLDNNPEIKSYVEHLEMECLDIQALIFEEANLQIQKALMSESQACKKAFEKEQENYVLKAECHALKQMIENLDLENNDEPIYPVKFQSTSSSKFLRRLSSIAYPDETEKKVSPIKKNLTMSSTEMIISRENSPFESPNFKKKMKKQDKIKSSSNSSLSVTNSNAKSRTEFFNKIVDKYGFPENVESILFEEFQSWFISGCDLSFFNVVTLTVHGSVTTIDRNHARDLFPTYNDEVETDNESGNSSIDSDWGTDSKAKLKTRNQSHSFVKEESNSTIISRKGTQNLGIGTSLSSSAYSSLTSQASCRGQNFLIRLLNEDILPSWKFADSKFTNDLLRALVEERIEISLANYYCRTTSKDKNNTSQESLINSSPLNKQKICPLIPKHEALYELRINRLADSPIEKVLMISKCARDRIASVVNLYMFLRQIRTLNLTKKCADQVAYDYEELKKHFHSVQKRRLSVSMAKLGFGLPDCE